MLNLKIKTTTLMCLSSAAISKTTSVRSEAPALVLTNYYHLWSMPWSLGYLFFYLRHFQLHNNHRHNNVKQYN